ncbi:MAG: response regulator [Vampirovibrionales bacterium]|nr:response regulator [Vampirovibrionales bacterium]
MSLQVVLIIGKDPGWASALMEKLAGESLVECLHLEKLEEARQLIDAVLPDLILLFADSLEAAGEDVNTFCRQIRERAFTDVGESKPVVVVQTDSPKEDKRIQYLLDGADDTLSSHLSPEELRVRVLVQLRRNIDTLSNNITLLPGLDLASKVIQRKINLQRLYPEMAWAVLLIELDNFDVYNEIYGYLAGNQALRTFAVMLANLVMAPDLIGHSAETDTFIVITSPDRAEKLSRLVCKQFAEVSPNFYSDKDRKRGYVVAVDEGRVSRRVPLLTVSIGVVNSETAQYESYKAAFTAGMDMKALARMSSGNTWVSDKFKLTGAKTVEEQPATPHILVVESDAALAFLLKTTLEMQHYEVEAVGTPKEALEAMAAVPAQLVLMDALLNDEESGWELCEAIKAQYPYATVIFMSTIHDRERALSAGADLYLPKPFELIALFSSIDRVLKVR